jgi:uncharacterized membrane protein
MMFFHVIQEQRVHIFQDLIEAFERQERLVDSIGRLLAVSIAFQLIALYFLFDDGGYHVVLICKELVDGLFGNAQLGSDLIHRDRSDAIAAEQISRLRQYSLFYFHNMFCLWSRDLRPERKTMETFYVVKVSIVFFIICRLRGLYLLLPSKLLLMPFRQIPRKLFRLFLQGVIVLGPISITVWAVVSLFIWIDNILPNLLHGLFPSLVGIDQFGLPTRIPGLGFVVFIGIALFVGYISPSFIVSRLMDLADSLLERTPGIKFIYSTIKDFFEAFAGNKRKFDKSVLVAIGAPDVWQVGFITQEELKEFGLVEYVAVYVPQSYSLAGRLYFVKRDRIRVLTDISSADAMKFAISGGVTEIGDMGDGHTN